MDERLNRIHKRQLARFLNHLKDTGKYSTELERDVKRSFGYIFEDVNLALGHDKELENGNQGSRQSF